MKNSMENQISSILGTVDCYCNLDCGYSESKEDLKEQYEGYICIKRSDLIEQINKYFNTTENEYIEVLEKLGLTD